MPISRALLWFKGLLLLMCAFQFDKFSFHAEGAALTFNGFEVSESKIYEEKLCNVPTRESGCYCRQY